MIKRTQEEFEYYVTKANPNIKVLGEYVNNATRIRVKCNDCGRVWDALPTRITVRYQCPLCKRQDIFNAFLTNNELTTVDEYQNDYSKIKIKCKKCGYTWECVPKSLKRDPRCPNCYKKGHKAKWTDEIFAKEMRKISPNLVLDEKYSGYDEKILCHCIVCGYSFSQSAHQLLMGRGCPKCNGHQRWTDAEFNTQLKKVNPNIEVTGFSGIKKRIHCKCLICGYEWEPIADSVLRGRGCSRCGGHEKLDFSKFKAEFEALNHNIEILDTDVKNTTTMIKCRCKRCDNIWLTNINRLKQGFGCKLCNHSATSFMEQAILHSLQMRLGKTSVLSRNKSEIGEELDIYIPSKQLAFEPGSWNFHSKKIKKDDKKRQLCQNKGIRLITIYDSFSGDSAPFPSDCLVVKEDLGVAKNRALLKQLIDQLFLMCKIYPYISNIEWDKIQEMALEQSMRPSMEDFIRDIGVVNPKIEILGKPTKSHEKILCRCRVCGHEWLAKPVYLKRGVGCPVCGGTKKLTQEEFEKKLRYNNPSIIAVESYITMTKPIRFHCNQCGYEWESSPREMLKQSSPCPLCKKKQQLLSALNKRGITITDDDKKMIKRFSELNTSVSYSTEEFVWLISKINPKVEVIGQYSGMNKSIECRCNQCGNTWLPRAQHILNGHGCPQCNKLNNW